MFKSKRMISSIISGVLAVQILTSTVFNPSGLGNVEAAKGQSVKGSSSTVSESVYSTTDAGAMKNEAVIAGDKFNGKRIIVKYKDSAKAKSNISNVEKSVGKKLKKLKKEKELNSGKLHVYKIDETDDMQGTIEKFKKNENVEYVQEDFKLTSFDIPTDTRFNEQWHLYNNGQDVYGQTGTSGVDINALKAWTKTKGSEEVVVGVIDSGVDVSHEDLAPNIYINKGEIPNDGLDNDGNNIIDDYSGYDFYNDDCTVYDSASDQHGTHVAGILGAADNGAGICGVATKIKVLPVKFIEGNSGFTSDAIEAINYCKTMNVDAVNISWGSTAYNQALKDAMEESGLLFITAAGNCGVSTSAVPIYPACFDLPNILSVAAVDNSGNLASFSSYGSDVDVAAPGLNILSTLPNNQYGTLSGTSMACPTVTGIAALLKSYEPDITVDEIINRIKSNVVKSYKLEGKVATGGRVDANAVLDDIVPQAEVGNFVPNTPYTINNNENKDIEDIINESQNNSAGESDKIVKPLVVENSLESEQKTNNSTHEQLGIDGVKEGIQPQSISTLSYTYEVEPNNTSSTGMTVPIGTTFGTAAAANDNDWYIVYLEANKQYSFRLTGIQTGDDLGLFLFKPDLTDADFSDNFYNADENLTYTTSVAGYYYIDAYCFTRGSAANHNYQMLVYPNNASPDSYEPNDSTTTAKTISNNTSVSGTINITTDDDWYVIDTTETGKLTVSLEGIPSGCDYDISVYDNTISYVGGSYNSGNTKEKANILIGNTGKYYIRVYSYSGTNASSKYSLNAVVSIPDNYESNDYTYEATRVDVGTSVLGTIDNIRDQDWYKVTIDETIGYTFELENIPSGRDYDMYIYNEAGTYVSGSACGSNNDELINTTLSAGTYYVKIYPYSNYSDERSYTFSVYENSAINISMPYLRANAGDEIVVPVYIDSVPQGGICSFDFKVKYDKSVMSYTGYEAGALTNSTSVILGANETSNGINILYLDNSTTFSNPITSAGELIKLKFTVNTATTDGAFELTYNDGWSFGKRINSDVDDISNVVFKPGIAMVGSYGLSSLQTSAQPIRLLADGTSASSTGDVNGDGAANSIDFGLMRMALLGKIQLSQESLSAADVNGDGAFNSLDFGVMRQYLLGIIKVFPKDTMTPTVTPTPTEIFTPTPSPTLAPINLVGTCSGTEMALSWTVSTTEGVIGYKVYRSDGKVFATNETNYNDTGLKPGATYIYYVTAYDEDNNEYEKSNSISTGVSNINITENEENYISISWDAVIGAKEYQVCADGIINETVTGTSYKHSGLIKNTWHSYKVLAKFNSGTSAWSETLRVCSAPQKPIEVNADIEGDKATISWQEVPGAAKYQILKGTVAVEVEGCEYVDEGLELNKDNIYEIKALDSSDAQLGNSGRVLVNAGIGVIDKDTPMYENRVYGSLENGKNLNLNTYNLSVRGDSYLRSGLIDIDGGILSVRGNISQADCSMYLNGGQMYVDGNYIIKNSGDWSKSSLIMNNSDDYVLVEGDFVQHSYNNHKDKLTAGTLEVKGDFTQESSGDVTEILTEGQYNLKCSLKDGLTLVEPGSGIGCHYPYGNATYGYTGGWGSNSELIVGDITNLTEGCISRMGHSWIDFEQGTNEYLFTKKSITDRWCGLYFYGFNTSMQIGAVKLIFDNEDKISIKEAVALGYIYPLVPIQSFSFQNYYVDGQVGQWTNIVDLIDGTSLTNEGDHRVGLFMFKMKSSAVNLSGVEFYCDKKITAHEDTNNWLSGFNAFMLSEDYDLSIVPSDQDYNFAASGTHRVILSGEKVQTVKFDNPEQSNFNKLCITKPLEYGYIMKNAKWNTLEENYSNANPMPGTMITKPSLTPAREGLAMAEVNGRIYAFGGKTDSDEYLNTVSEYDYIANEWTEFTADPNKQMQTGKSDFAIAATDNDVYIFGGTDGSNYFNTVERYNPTVGFKDDRVPVPPMPTARSGAKAVIIDNKIYVVGGVNEKGYLNTIDVYDIEDNSWSTINSNTNIPRTDFGMAAYGKSIYIFGGCNDDGIIDTVEEYDTTTGNCTEKTSLPTKTKGLQACNVDGKIYLFCGTTFDGKTTKVTNSVDSYDTQTHTYLSVEADKDPKDNIVKLKSLQYARTSFGAVAAFGRVFIAAGNNGTKCQSAAGEYVVNQLKGTNFGADYNGKEGRGKQYDSNGANVLTGNYLTQSTDISIDSPAMDVEVVRSYNSSDADTEDPLVIGNGWRMSFETFAKSVTTNRYKVTASTLNFRQAPPNKEEVYPTDWDVICGLSEGTIVDLTDNMYNIMRWSNGSEWYEVKTLNNKTGWVSKRYLSEVPGVQITYPSGTKIMFKQAEGKYEAPVGCYDELTKTTVDSKEMYKLKKKDQSAYLYNASTGKLEYQEDRYGNRIKFEYSNGQLITIYDCGATSAAIRRTLSLNYTVDKLSSIVDGAKRTVYYNYTNGKLSSVTDLNGKVTKYEYYSDGEGSKNKLQKIKKINDDIADNKIEITLYTNFYDSLGRIIKQLDSNNKPAYYLYKDLSANDTSSMTTEGIEICREYYNRRGDLTKEIYNVNFPDRPIKVIDAIGKETRTKYYLNGKLGYKETTTLTDEQLKSEDYEDLWTTNLPQKYETTEVIKINGTETEVNKTIVETDAKENVKLVTNPDNTTRKYDYYPNGDLEYMIDEMNYQTYYYYETFGSEGRKRLKKIIRPVKPVESSTTINDITDASVFDNVNNAITTYDYTNKQTLSLVSKTTNPDNTWTSFVYDDNGTLLESTVGENNKTENNKTGYTYDNCFRVKTITTALLNKTTYEYDNMNNVTKVKREADGEETSIIRTFYDYEGRKVKEANSLMYDESKDLSSGYTGNFSDDYVYDAFGRVLTHNQYVQRFDPDTKITTKDTYTHNYTYDGEGYLENETKNNGAVYVYNYDEAGRITAEYFKAGSGATAVLLNEYAYNEGIKLENGTYGTEKVQTKHLADKISAVTKYLSDYKGRVVKVTNDSGGFTKTEYYDDGNVKSFTDFNGNKTLYTYKKSENPGFVYDEKFVPVTGEGASTKYSYSKVIYNLNGRKISEIVSVDLVEVSVTEDGRTYELKKGLEPKNIIRPTIHIMATTK